MLLSSRRYTSPYLVLALSIPCSCLSYLICSLQDTRRRNEEKALQEAAVIKTRCEQWIEGLQNLHQQGKTFEVYEVYKNSDAHPLADGPLLMYDTLVSVPCKVYTQ